MRKSNQRTKNPLRKIAKASILFFLILFTGMISVSSTVNLVDPSTGGGAGVAENDTQKRAGGHYLYNSSDIIYVNETSLNSTIDARSSAASDTNESVWIPLLLNNDSALDAFIKAVNTTQAINDLFADDLTVDTDTDTTCDGQTCGVDNTGTLDGHDAQDFIDMIDAINGTSVNDPVYINYKGTDLSGTDGTTHRNLTGDPTMVIIDNYVIHPKTQYNVTGGEIIFYVNVWDDQDVLLYVNSTLLYTNYDGSDFSGTTGDHNRTITHTSAEIVVVDNFEYMPGVTCEINSTHVRIIPKLWDDQKVTIWR